MGYWIVFIAILFLVWGVVKERFTDPEECKAAGVDRSGKPCVPKLTRPSLEDPGWRSKIEAEMPIGQQESDYVQVLQAFHDKIYKPAVNRPTEAQVDAFLKSPDASVAGTSPESTKRMIMSGFRLQSGLTAAAREEKQLVKTGALAGFQGKELEPKMAVDQVRTRKEIPYIPADTRQGELPEGIYAPTKQQPEPRNSGDWNSKSTSWSDVQFFGIKNVQS